MIVAFLNSFISFLFGVAQAPHKQSKCIKGKWMELPFLKIRGLVFLEKKMLVLFSGPQDLSLPIADIHQPLKYSLGGAHVTEVK